MKLFLICIILCFQNSFGQADGEILHLKKIGWTLKFPEGFRRDDNNSVEDSTTLELITDSSHASAIVRRQFVVEKGKNVLFISCFNFTDRPINNENLDETNSRSKNILFDDIIKTGHFKDSITTTETIKGLKFYKSKITVQNGGDPPLYYTYLTTLLNGYYATFIFVCTEKIVGDQIENMLKTSVFDK